MRITEFGSVGKIPFFKATGVKQNGNGMNAKLDEKASGCFSCPVFVEKTTASASGNQAAYEAAVAKCSACPNRIFGRSKNADEKRYGKAEPVCATAVSLFLLLHLCSPSATGVVSGFSIGEAAEFLGCCSRTVRNCLNLLHSRGYIVSSNGEKRGERIIVINGYDKYFAKASEGGRGYVVVTEGFVHRLSRLDGVNEVRLCTREYLAIDERRIKGAAILDPSSGWLRKDVAAFGSVRSVLPSYIRPSAVKKVIFACSSIFNIEELENGAVSFTLEPTLFGPDEKARRQSEAESMIRKDLEAADEAIEKKVNGEIGILGVPEWLRKTAVLPVQELIRMHIMPDDKDLEDLIQMSVSYSVEAVLSAVHAAVRAASTKELRKGINYGPAVRAALEEMENEAA